MECQRELKNRRIVKNMKYKRRHIDNRIAICFKSLAISVAVVCFWWSTWNLFDHLDTLVSRSNSYYGFLYGYGFILTASLLFFMFRSILKSTLAKYYGIISKEIRNNVIITTTEYEQKPNMSTPYFLLKSFFPIFIYILIVGLINIWRGFFATYWHIADVLHESYHVPQMVSLLLLQITAIMSLFFTENNNSIVLCPSHPAYQHDELYYLDTMFSFDILHEQSCRAIQTSNKHKSMDSEKTSNVDAPACSSCNPTFGLSSFKKTLIRLTAIEFSISEVLMLWLLRFHKQEMCYFSNGSTPDQKSALKITDPYVVKISRTKKCAVDVAIEPRTCQLHNENHKMTKIHPASTNTYKTANITKTCSKCYLACLMVCFYQIHHKHLYLHMFACMFWSTTWRMYEYATNYVFHQKLTNIPGLLLIIFVSQCLNHLVLLKFKECTSKKYLRILYTYISNINTVCIWASVWYACDLLSSQLDKRLAIFASAHIITFGGLAMLGISINVAL